MTLPDDHHFADRTLLGMRLKEWRMNNNLKTAAAARELGVSTSTWGHWETGHTFPSGEMLLDICRLMNLPLQLLFCPHLDTCPFAGEGTNPPPKEPFSCQHEGCPAPKPRSGPTS